MNDKCAGGTGAVIDKINAKVRIPAEELCNMGYLGLKLHPVAGKCGVFAETDINGLQKSGVPPSELMASLFEAIIQQNLAVLTRGNTLRPTVLLLGGPNTYIKGMQDCWKYNIPKVWEERNFPLPEGKDPKDLIMVPDNAQYFAALGCVRFAMDEDDERRHLQGLREAGVVHQLRPPGREAEEGRQRPLQDRERAAANSRIATSPRSLFPTPSSPASTLKPSWASTAAPLPPKPCW